MEKIIFVTSDIAVGHVKPATMADDLAYAHLCRAAGWQYQLPLLSKIGLLTLLAKNYGYDIETR